MAIIALTSSDKTFHQLSFYWGVTPFRSNECFTLAEGFEKISSFALSNQLVSYGDLVVVTAGSPFGVSGTTNMMIVENIGDVLIRGHNGYGERIYGNIAVVLSADNCPPYTIKDQIIVITRCDKTYLPLFQEAAGIILQNHINDIASEKYAKKIALTLNKPLLLRADAACRTLKDGQLVTLDPVKALVYKGVVLEVEAKKV
jgi:pyruvate kinase